MKVLAIIPAKLDSKRLKHKNIREVGGKPMFLHSVDYARQSSYDVEVIVSSESSTVEQICKEHNITFHTRSKDCLLYTSPSPRDRQKSRMPSSA